MDGVEGGKEFTKQAPGWQRRRNIIDNRLLRDTCRQQNLSYLPLP